MRIWMIKKRNITIFTSVVKTKNSSKRLASNWGALRSSNLFASSFFTEADAIIYAMENHHSQIHLRQRVYNVGMGWGGGARCYLDAITIPNISGW